jgi:hypothetical protein
MKAYVYGYVNGYVNSGIVPLASSDGYTVARTATGKYKITFTNTSLTTYKYIATAVVAGGGSPEFATIYQNDGNFDITIWNLSGVHVNSDFTFVVYKK